MRLRNVIDWVFTGTHGGPTRARIVEAMLTAGPLNANQLAACLELDYTTVRHHLDNLSRNGLVKAEGPRYGRTYRPTEAFLSESAYFFEVASRFRKTLKE